MLTSCSDSRPIAAQQGVLDATKWNFNEDRITLNGEWEFYWNQLLQPQDFVDTLSKSYIQLPGVWNDVDYEGNTLQGEGYATFRIKIKTDLKNERFGLRIPFHFTAYKLWVNQELLAENGIVGKTKSTSTPQTLPTYVYFEVPEGDIIITLQVSNFHFYKGGAPAPYNLGLEGFIKKNQTQQFATDLFLTGSLFIMAFYHLGLFLLRRKEISTLYFCFVCLLMMLRTLCLSETFLIILYPNFNFELYIKLVFISLYIGPSLFILFIEKLFPQDAKPKIGKIFFRTKLIFSKLV